MNHREEAGQIKWRSVIGVLCNHIILFLFFFYNNRIHIKLNRKFCKITETTIFCSNDFGVVK